ncbi:MAG: YihY/virulence factor BrkB family protein [bacterium]|nr:YihY/virulence factor BrkB family protein [bacterium]
MSSIKRRIKAFKDRLLFNIFRPEMRVLPGGIAFFFFIALIPLISIIGSLISLLNLPYGSISDVLNTYLPNGTANLLEAIAVKIDFNFNFIIFFFSSVLLASNGTHSMIIASNQIYKIKDTNYIRRRSKAFLMMLVVLILLMFILFVPVFGDMIFKLIDELNGASTIKNTMLLFYNILKYPLSIIFIYWLIKIIYIMAPDKKINRNNVTYGSLFTSISWVFLTRLYSWYVENFTNYNTFYGSISSILILVLWLYLLCYLFVLGMALNVSKYEILLTEEK